MRWLREWSLPITVGLTGMVVTIATLIMFGPTL